MPRSAPPPVRHPASVQGGDLTCYPPGQITLDLSVCANRHGPPPGAVRALKTLLATRPEDLVPPPYGAQDAYLAAVADHLGLDTPHLLIPGRGVSEFIVVLSRVLRGQDVALVVPDYTHTWQRFAYATAYAPKAAAKDTAERRLERVRRAMSRHRFVVLSNPSNPLGHYLPQRDLLEVCRRYPHSVLGVDEEYIEFEGKNLSLAGSDLDNVVAMLSTGKTYGLTAARAGILWTRNLALREAVTEQLIPWSLSLLDVALHVEALADPFWLDSVRPLIQEQARALERMLVERFGDAVAAADLHYRFVHLPEPAPLHAHLAARGIAVRQFDGTGGTAPGIRIAAPRDASELDRLQQALIRISFRDKDRS
ncbi:aminotransferase class I/II-fold pyridoxal phosphate-dependent enzyme [Streptomyces sp. NPDC055078]